ncbi:Protein serine/threonine kinase [Entamoeba marina]
MRMSFLLLLFCNITYAQCYDECKYCLWGLCHACTDGGCATGAWQLDRLCSYCYKCKRGCTLCDEEWWCTSCESGYYLRAFDGSQLCETCPDGCNECSSPTTCTSCSDGYYLEDGICYKCPYGCNECNGPDSCSVCERGYGMVDNWCYSCSEITCSSCQEGTYLVTETGLCAECTSQCETCSSSSVCTSCKEGYYLSGGSCVLCSSSITGCTKCSSDGSTCTECATRYRLINGTCDGYEPTICQDGYGDPYGDCDVCNGGDGCRTCDGGDNTCTGCKDGYYLVDEHCYECSVDNCRYCDSTGTCSRFCSDHAECNLCESECKTCSRGYSFNYGSCTKCQNCTDCNTQICFQCNSGNTPSTGNSCEYCSNVFSHCSSCSTTTSYCNSCDTGYTFQKQLVETVTYVVHTTNKECTDCDDGYTLIDGNSSDSSSCVGCSTAFSYCEECSQTEVKCSVCAVGYEFSGDDCVEYGTCDNGLSLYNGYCYDCSREFDNCNHCNSNEWGCQVCNTGYLYIDGACYDCNITNCITCSTDSYECTQCEDNYGAIGNECISCSDVENCYACGDNFTCAYCKIGYDLVDYNCVTCTDSRANCIETDSNGYCEYGNFPVDGYCYNCSIYKSNCEVCSTEENKCLLCKEGYGLNGTNSCESCQQGSCKNSSIITAMNGVCEECNIARCTSCNENSTECVVCENNKIYDTISETCTYKTTDLCSAYDSSSSDYSTCHSCPNSYRYQNGECIQCSTGCLNCDYNGCIQCSEGYYLVNEECVESNPHCSKVNNKSECFECNNGYYFNSTTQMCYECSEGCSSCQNVNSCSRCEINYVLYNRTSSTIIPNCFTEGQTGCLRCDTGYYVDMNSMCSPCNETGHSLTNAECPSGNNTHCTQTIPSSNKCAICEDGYYTSNGNCYECSETCILCRGTSFSCISCSDNFYFDSNGYCSNCSTIDYCISCDQDGCTECQKVIMYLHINVYNVMNIVQNEDNSENALNVIQHIF